MVLGITLYELIASSNRAHSLRGSAGQYGMSNAMSKVFGTIYYNDKVVYYDPRNRILEIRMFMGTETETAYKGYHAVRMAIYNVRGKVYNSLEELYNDKVANALMNKDIMAGDKEEKDPVGEDRAEHMAIMKDSIKGDHTGWRARGFDKTVPDLDSNRVEIDYANEINTRLTGAIIPVASRDATDFGHRFGHSGQFFYLEDNYIDYNSYVRVSCSCSSYFYRFAWNNFYQGVHLGQRPAPYHKISKSNKDINVQNIDKDTGMCKHLLMFTMLLLNGGIINRLGVKDFEKNRSAIMNREERLRIPKQIATKREMEKIYRTITRNMKTVEKARESSEAIAAYKSWQKNEYEKNTAHGVRYNKGVSKGAYYDKLASLMPKPIINNKTSENFYKKKGMSYDKIVEKLTNYDKYKNQAAKNMHNMLMEQGNLETFVNSLGGVDKYKEWIRNQVKLDYGLIKRAPSRGIKKRRHR